MPTQSTRRFISLLAAFPLALLAAISAAQAGDDSITKALGEGMAGFVAGLDENQRDEALYAFDDAERFDLRLAPIGLEGLKISQMSDAQWVELEGLLSGVLSPAGLEKMNTIRSLEREVAAIEGGLFGFFAGWMRDTKRYFLTDLQYHVDIGNQF